MPLEIMVDLTFKRLQVKMMKQFWVRQMNAFTAIYKDKRELSLFAILLIFILLNTIKVSIFNLILTDNKSAMIAEYKVIYTFLFMVILTNIFLVLKSRILFFLVYLLQSLYILINISYYMFFHSYLHVMQFIMLFNEGFTAANQSSAPINLKMLIILIDLPGFILVLKSFHRIIDFRKSKRFLTVMVTCFSLILLGAIEVRSYYNEWSLVHLVQSKYNGEKPIVERYGTVVNNVLGIYLNRNEKVIIDKLKYGEVQAGKANGKDKPNFIFIQVEAMDSNVINKKYKGSYITPFLNSLKDSSVYYPYVLSEHMGGGTSDIEFAVINSIEPLEGYSAQKLSNYNYPNSFIKVLRKNSYSAIGFHGNKGSFFNRNISFPKMGFERLVDMDDMGFKDVGWGAPDRDVLNYAYDIMTKLNGPFISYIITMTSHGPFTNASKYYENKVFEGVENVNIKNYFNSMSYVDKVLEDFIKRAKSKFKNTYIFIYGDHTPSIRDKEYMQASFDYDNKYFEFVPLFILTPDNKKYIEKSRVASMLDFSPTLLKASGLEFKIKSDGANLLEFKNEWRGIKFKDMIYKRQFLYGKIKGIK